MRYSRFKTPVSWNIHSSGYFEMPLRIFTRLTYRVCVHKRCAYIQWSKRSIWSKRIHVVDNNCHRPRFLAINRYRLYNLKKNKMKKFSFYIIASLLLSITIYHDLNKQKRRKRFSDIIEISFTFCLSALYLKFLRVTKRYKATIIFGYVWSFQANGLRDRDGRKNGPTCFSTFATTRS